VRETLRFSERRVRFRRARFRCIVVHVSIPVSHRDYSHTFFLVLVSGELFLSAAERRDDPYCEAEQS
jgi:hypothetical protein